MTVKPGSFTCMSCKAGVAQTMFVKKKGWLCEDCFDQHEEDSD